MRIFGRVILGLALSALAATAQAQTTFTYRELDRAPAGALARKTLGALGEDLPLLRREPADGMIWTGSRYFTFAGTPHSSFYRGCETRRAHAEYRPLQDHGRHEPPDAKLKLESVWFENAYARLPNAPEDDGSNGFERRMNRLCAKFEPVFDMFSAENSEAALRAVAVIDRLAAEPAPELACGPGPDCRDLVRRILAGRLHHVKQWDCGPLDGKLPMADVIVCQELRFDLATPSNGHVGALRVRFREGTDPKTQKRFMALQAVYAEEAIIVE